MRHWLWLAAACSVPLPVAAAVTGEDLAGIRGAIERRIEALGRDEACAPVHRPARLAFRDLLIMSGEVVQQVAVTDRAGSRWIAYFSMHRHEDGGWRANDCRLVQPDRTISA